MRSLLRHRHYWLLPPLLWGVLVAASLGWNLNHVEQHVRDSALERARFVFQLVESVRLWNARHGGVYARIDAHTSPNPWLKVPERDIESTSGLHLTMINPAYMTRQLAAIMEELSEVRIHLTSLRPLNPNNQADPWERRALTAFEQGTRELTEFDLQADPSRFRYIAPLRVHPACMECHAEQGYQVGDVRGGVSIAFNVTPLVTPLLAQWRTMVAIHVGVWLLLWITTQAALSGVRRRVLELAAAKAQQDELVLLRTTELRREVAERQAAEERLRRLLNSSGEGVFGVDRDGHITFANPMAVKLLEFDSEVDLLGRKVHGLIHHSYLDGTPREDDDCVVQHTLRSGEAVHVDDDVFWTRNGRAMPVEYRAHPMQAGGSQIGAVVTFSDVSERRRREARLRQLSKAVEFSPDAVVITDAKGQIEFINRRFLESTGYSEAEVLGQRPSLLKSGDTPPETYQQLWATISAGRVWHGRFHNRRKDGSLFWEEASITPITDEKGVITHYVGLKKDITERQELEARIWRQANFDALTGLPNRRLFQDRLERALATARRERQRFGLMFIDLDRFKEVNDTLGHDAGDALLKQVAARLSDCVRQSDTVARMGGDEFTVILSQLNGADGAESVAEKILVQLALPFTLVEEVVQISASIGIAYYPEHGGSSTLLMKRADSAMYRAKAAGRNAFRIYAPYADGQRTEP